MADIMKPTSNQVTIYETEDGRVRVEVRFEQENLWLSQKLMASLFECSPDNISLHLRNIYNEKELDEGSTAEDFSVVQNEGGREVTRRVRFYSLEAIIAVGYRVNSVRGTQFRTWATDKLKNYILKGFAIDSDRFKYGTRFDARYFEELLEEIREIRASERMVYQKITDIYATAVDYSPSTAEAEKFFATVQNKMHFAITGKTAAEVIAQRADKTRPHMGLTTWRKAPAGKIMKSDVGIAKNYLQKEELKSLNHIVDMYLDYAELQASRGRLMKMRDWEEKLNAFLQFNELDVLQNKGKVSREVALALAEKSYEVFRIEQDRSYISDFDREVKKLKAPKTPKNKKAKKP
ncbi:MAG: virulence RhuM family protein [Deltaproteobacteria bacterium]|nr:virulence RhuM family protein [Deltaproteobacteria bacterium]